MICKLISVLRRIWKACVNVCFNRSFTFRPLLLRTKESYLTYSEVQYYVLRNPIWRILKSNTTYWGILFDVLINTILRTQKFYIVSTGILYYALRNLILWMRKYYITHSELVYYACLNHILCVQNLYIIRADILHYYTLLYIMDCCLDSIWRNIFFCLIAKEIFSIFVSVSSSLCRRLVYCAAVGKTGRASACDDALFWMTEN